MISTKLGKTLLLNSVIVTLAFAGVTASTPGACQTAVPDSPSALSPSGTVAFPFLDTAFQSDSLTIPARVLLPNGPGPFPLLVVATGTESLTRTHPAYNRAYRLYLEAGIAVMLFDDRGTGDTPGEADPAAPLPQLARDVVAAVRHARTLPAFNPEEIGILGISRGGWTGPLAAAEAPAEVAFLALVSAPPMTPLEQNIFNNTNQLAERGFTEDERREVAAFREVVWTYYATGEGYDRARAVWREASSKPWFAKLNLRPEPAAPDQITGPNFRFYRNGLFDPEPILRSLQLPIIAVYGSEDRIVDPDRSAPMMTRILEQSGHPNATVVTILNAGHNIRPVRDGAEARPGVAESPPHYPAVIVDWITRQLSRKRARG